MPWIKGYKRIRRFTVTQMALPGFDATVHFQCSDRSSKFRHLTPKQKQQRARLYAKLMHLRNGTSAADTTRVWRAANPDKKGGNMIARRTASSDLFVASQKKKHLERIKKCPKRKAAKAAYEKKRKATFPHVRLIGNMRRRLCLALNGKAKSASTMRLVGCDRDALVKHIEGHFKDGMGWHNYGMSGWVVDHIIPVSLFDMNLADHQRACFHFLNLQPLWSSLNSAKRNKVSMPHAETVLTSLEPFVGQQICEVIRRRVGQKHAERLANMKAIVGDGAFALED